MAQVSFFQLVKGTDYLETASTTERDNLLNNGWSYGTSPTCDIFQNAADYSGSVALYRLQDPTYGGYYYTTDSTARSAMIAAGWADQGIAGYVVSPNSSQPSGWGTLQYAQNKTSHYYIFTACPTQWSALGSGWTKYGTVCYVPSPHS